MPDQPREVLDSIPDLPLFMQPWWLDGVAADRWGACLHRDAEGRLDGALTFCLSRRRGFSLIHPAPLSPYSGFWFHYPDGGEMKVPRQVAFRQEILLALLGQLPPAEITIQQLQVGQNEVLPLLWKGWQQQLRFTFRLEDPIDTEAQFKLLRSSLRHEIRSAGQQLGIEEEVDSREARLLFRETLQRKSASSGLSDPALEGLISEAQARGQGMLLGARDAQGLLQSAVLVAWDRHTLYYLLSGSRHEGIKGANALLIWEAIRRAAAQGLRFDFEGGMQAGIGQFFAAFGAQPQPYLSLNRCSNRFWAFIGQWRYGL